MARLHSRVPVLLVAFVLTNALHTIDDTSNDNMIRQKTNAAEEDPNASMIRQKTNAAEEDRIALDIFDQLVNIHDLGNADVGVVQGCFSLSKMIQAYANPLGPKWIPGEDDKNPELPFKVSGISAAEKISKYQSENAKLQKLRNIATKLIGAGPKCSQLWYFLGSDITRVRILAPYEFQFKEGRWGPPGSNMMDNDEVRAYNHARCKSEHQGDCNKDTINENLKFLFQHKKGRALVRLANDKYKIFKSLHAGIRVSRSYPQVLNVKLKNFWEETGDAKFKSGLRYVDDLGSAFTDCIDLQVETCAEAGEEALHPDTTTMCEDIAKFCDVLEKENFAEIYITRNIHVGAFPEFRQLKNREGVKVNQNAALVVDRFLECGVPWVGGVSGSVLEMFAFNHRERVPIDDRIILQWMALYVLRGFHSIGEVWTAMKPFLDKLAETDHDITNLKMMTVQPPMSMDGVCTVGGEEKFLEQVAIVVQQLTDESCSTKNKQLCVAGAG